MRGHVDDLISPKDLYQVLQGFGAAGTGKSTNPSVILVVDIVVSDTIYELSTLSVMEFQDK